MVIIGNKRGAPQKKHRRTAAGGGAAWRGSAAGSRAAESAVCATFFQRLFRHKVHLGLAKTKKKALRGHFKRQPSAALLASFLVSVENITC